MAQLVLNDQNLIAYLVAALERTHRLLTSRPTGDPAHALALGEAVALFNLADEFGVVADVRAEVDARVGADAYRLLSEAMKRYYLGVPSGGGGGTGRAGGRRPPRPRSG